MLQNATLGSDNLSNGMDPSDICLHPYRKRKFFYGLAELFDEQPPLIQSLSDVFSPSSSPVAASQQGDEDQVAIDEQVHEEPTDDSPVHAPPYSPSQEPEEDSFEYVDFGKPRTSLESSASLRAGLHSQTQSSIHDSMQDSLLFLPPELKRAAGNRISFSQPRELSEDDCQSQPTVLSVSSSPGATRRSDELIDYYDLDRFCEAVPCWAYENQSSCPLHTEPIRRPMLLFCLQALDEFIASSTIMEGENLMVKSCRLARAVFASMWEKDTRLIGKSADVVIGDYLSETISIPGISQSVWQLIDGCWHRHKQSYLHHQELYFVDNEVPLVSNRQELWRRVRGLLQIYGLRPSQARRLAAADERLGDETSIISDRELEWIAPGFPSVLPVRVGIDYLRQMAAKSSASPPENPLCGWRHDLMGHSEWKQAFHAIQIHLTKWSRHAQVFACGSFVRGAAFGSAIDVVVGLPENDPAKSTAAPVSQVLEVLERAKVVQKDCIQLLGDHRALGIIPFMGRLLLLDLKVYTRPQSWFALLYFTGPESFSRAYYSQLLKRSLSELSFVDFDHIYERVVEHLGLEVVASVDSEKHLFDLVQSEYLLPPHRM